MKKTPIISLMAIFIITMLCSCGTNKNIEPPPTLDMGAWLENPDNSAQLQYISVNIFSNTWERGVAATGNFSISEDEKNDVLGYLGKVSFDPMSSYSDKQEYDFAFAMNEPFIFFIFTDDSLIVKVPSEKSGEGYSYFQQTFEKYPQLQDLKEYIGELRLSNNQ